MTTRGRAAPRAWARAAAALAAAAVTGAGALAAGCAARRPGRTGPAGAGREELGAVLFSAPAGPADVPNVEGGFNQSQVLLLLRLSADSGAAVERRPVLLTRGGQGGDDMHPAWRPDGGTVAFASTRGGRPDIYVMAADGSGLRNLTSDLKPGSRNPAWSPDGWKLAFDFSRGGPADIFAMKADGGGKLRLTSDPADDITPAWSPDGRSLAFASDREGFYAVHVMAADGGPAQRLTPPGLHAWWPRWSPDGKQLAFTCNASSGSLAVPRALESDPANRVCLMRSDGSGLAALTAGPDDGEPAWSPDGRRLAFVSRQPRELLVLEVDGKFLMAVPGTSGADGPAWKP